MSGLNLESLSKSQLIARIDELEMRLEELKPKNADVLHTAWAFGLSRQEAEALCLLRSREFVTQDQMRAACAASDAALSGKSKLVDVIIHKLRKKLAETPIRIETLWGVGHKLASGKEYLDQVVEERRYR